MKVELKWAGRPCWVTVGDTKKERGIIHMIAMDAYVVPPAMSVTGTPGGQVSRPVAVVETENGNLNVVDIKDVQLLDTAAEMAEYEEIWLHSKIN